MKIYNEIILSWNDKTKQFDTIYEDSFNHIGDVMQLQGYGSGGGTGGGGSSSGGSSGGSSQENDTGQNTDDGYGELWHNENVEEYKQVVSTRITELLLSKFSLIEEILKKTDIESFQKTFREGEMNEGRNNNEMMVVYQNDYDANTDNGDVLTTIINWAGFIHPNYIGIHISSTNTMGGDGEETSIPVIALTAPNDKPPLDLSNIYGNISQFFNVDALKTQIDSSKLSNILSTDFGELRPETFTTVLDKYRNFKNQLPFFSYRTDDFFDEYSAASIPTNYRLQKFFEEFERLKEEIPAGTFGFDAVTVKAEGVSYYQFENTEEFSGPRLPRKLTIINKNGVEKIVYSNAGGRGHRVTIFSRDSFQTGDWNGTIKYDRVFDTYGGLSHFSGNNKDFGERTADILADTILSGQIVDDTGYIEIAEDDLIVVTSFDAVRYTPKLIQALRSIGAINPRVVEPEQSVDIAQDENLQDRLLARYHFSRPDSKTIGTGRFGGVQPGVYSSISQYSKPRHIIFNPNCNSIVKSDQFEDGHPALNFNRSNGEHSVSNYWRMTKQIPPPEGLDTIEQVRTDPSTEYQIDTEGIKGGCTYTFRVWMASKTIGAEDLSSFNPFHIRIFSSSTFQTLDGSNNVTNSPITGEGGVDAVVDTKTYNYLDGDAPATLTWYQKEITLSVPRNKQGLGSMSWYVGYYGFGENEPKPNNQDIEIHYCGFEMFEDVEEFNGYYNNGNYFDDSGGKSGQFHITKFTDMSSNDNTLQTIANNMSWLYTSQRGYTPKWNHGPNEHMIQKVPFIVDIDMTNEFPSIPESNIFYYPGTSYEPFPKSLDTIYEPGEVDYTIQMDLYLDAEYYTEMDWEQYSGGIEVDGPAGIDTTGQDFKSLGQGMMKIVSGPSWTIYLQGQQPTPEGINNAIPSGELLISFRAGFGEGTMLNNDSRSLRTHYILPLKTWVNIALTYDGSNLKFYVDGKKQWDITETGSSPFLTAEGAPSDWDGIPGYVARLSSTATNIRFQDVGKLLILDDNDRAVIFGDRAIEQKSPALQVEMGGRCPVNLSIDRFYLWNTILDDVQLYDIATNPYTELGDNKQRTPYSFIGSKLFGTANGNEKVTEASPEAEVAEVSQMWPNNVEYNTWEKNTAGYLISELQQFSNEQIPIYPSGKVSNMVNEISSLTDKTSEQSSTIQSQLTQINTLENNLSTIGQKDVEFHGDCESVSPGSYGCQDTVSSPDDNVNIFVTCTDGAKLPLFCADPLENEDEECAGQPTYPYGGPTDGQSVCEGV